MILVVGATGRSGGALLDLLVERGVPVRGLTRTEQGAEALRARGAEAEVGDLTDPGSLARAFARVERFYLATPEGGTQPELERNAIAVAEQSGAYAVVKLGCTGPAAEAHAEVVDALQATSLRWTILDAAAPLDVPAVAALAARALTEEGHETSTYPVAPAG